MKLWKMLLLIFLAPILLALGYFVIMLMIALLIR